MATLTPLTVGNASTPNGWTSAPNGNLGDNSDATYGYDDTNTTGAYDQGWLLDNVDSDFLTMDTLSVVLRYARDANNANKDWTSLQCRVVNGATILAAADSGGTFATIASSITTTTPTDSSSYSFDSSGYLNTTADKAAWDGATVEIRINTDRSKGGNSDQFRVHEADFTGTYSAGQTVTLTFDTYSASITAPQLDHRFTLNYDTYAATIQTLTVSFPETTTYFWYDERPPVIVQATGDFDHWLGGELPVTFGVGDAGQTVTLTFDTYSATITAPQLDHRLTLGLDDFSATIWAPDVEHSLTLSYDVYAATIYAPQLNHGLTVGYDTYGTIYAPQLDLELVLGLDSFGATIYAPDVEHSLTLGFDTYTASITAPQLDHGLTLGLDDFSATIYTHTVSNAAAPQTVTLSYDTYGATIQTLSVLPEQTVTLTFDTYTATITAPQLNHGLTLTETVFFPTIYAPAQFTLNVTLGLDSFAATIHTLTVGGQTVTLPYLDQTDYGSYGEGYSGLVIYTLTVAVDQDLTIGAPGSTFAATIYTLTVANEQDVTLTFDTYTATIQTLSVLPEQDVTTSYDVYAATIYAPDVEHSLTLGFDTFGATITAPQLDHSLTLGLDSFAATIWAPEVTGLTVTVGFDTYGAIYAPQLDLNVTLGLDTFTAAIYSLSLTSTVDVTLTFDTYSATITAPQLDHGLTLTYDTYGAVYAPTVAIDQDITLPELTSGAVWAPGVYPEQDVTLVLVSAGPTIWGPTLAVEIVLGGTEASMAASGAVYRRSDPSAYEESTMAGSSHEEPALVGASAVASSATISGTVEGS